ncbi:hypothetical protein Cphy_2250 [Lachnoclostridium phytofermentans ISDg]|uniref:Uncharacterized protein n=1 Tax=Lachnoclostridium phytofermentans (strain ATCC 700394 / DSM 18823 / ISDg) TaxID=357809 RepID=A9KK41_LACP7|nr:hypothetical protein Cphy_2250 [Lachnoclostridium phytofermentans ISDg]
MDVLDNQSTRRNRIFVLTNLKNKKALIDLGIYERDIDIEIKVIGDDFDDVSELKVRLTDSYSGSKDISYISRCIIKSLI